MRLPDGTIKFQLLSIVQFQKLPPPTWLVEDVIPAAGQSMVYGASGDGKSFLAVDVSMSVATGRPWNGRAVRQGPIIYLAAEGSAGLARRTEAWMRYHGVQDAPPAFFVPDAPQLHIEKKSMHLLKTIEEEPNLKNPALIVADTVARCFVGGDENTSQDVGRWIAGAGRIQTATGGAFMLVRHTKKAQPGAGAPQERGSSAFRGAADAMILVQEGRGAGCRHLREAEGCRGVQGDVLSLREGALEIRPRRTGLLCAGRRGAGRPDARNTLGNQLTVLRVISQFPDGAPTKASIKQAEAAGVPAEPSTVIGQH